MGWNDDSWRDGYDAWKLASPDDDYEEEDPCDHEDYDVDIVSGLANCNICSADWYVGEDEIRLQIERENAYAAYQKRENRWRWCRDLWHSERSIFSRRKQVEVDDEIPF
jgi:hypothetical protein